MKILLFENEQLQFEGAFKFVNKLYFNDQLEIKFLSDSQSGKPYADLAVYDLIFIDIELAPKSELDGFKLAVKLHEIGLSKKIVMLTGFSKVEDNLKELGLPLFPILQKPFSFAKLREIIQSFTP